jgi:signal transduction histidine kinase
MSHMIWRRGLSVATSAVVVVAGLATAVSVVRRGPGGPVDLWFVLATLLVGAAFTLVAALLVVVRPRNPLGPLLMLSGVVLIAQMALREVTYDGLVSGHPEAWERVLGWTSAWLDVLGLPLPLVLVLLLFPDGALPSRRWRPAVIVTVLVAAVRLALLVVAPGPVVLGSHDVSVRWSGLIDISGSAYDALDTATGALGAVLLLVAAVSLLVRYRAGDADIRQRLKPLGLSSLVMVLGLLVQLLPGLDTAGVVVFVLGGVSVPVALAVGALRYRVWDLDPLLVRAIEYAGLAVVIATVYVAVVEVVALAIGGDVREETLLPAVLATAAVAALFAPARSRFERAARRLVLGERASPYETLVALPQRLVDAPAVDEVLPATAETLARGLAAESAGVSVALDGGETWTAWFPAAPSADGARDSLTVRHLGVPVGELYVVPRPDRPLTQADRRLMSDLAAQAGPALHAVALHAELTRRLDQLTEQSAELTRSRRRLAVAQSEERRRLQQDLHDGAQQRLVAVAVQLGAVGSLLGRDPSAAQVELDRADGLLRESLDEIRELSRGLHPAMLEARGLTEALRSRATLSRQRVVVEAGSMDGVRLDPAIEAAAYFACLEALQNAAKHAPDSAVRVDLRLTDTVLSWSVSDDGPGFASTPGASNGGLAGMRERVNALGGELEVTTSPAGTVVLGRLPRSGASADSAPPDRVG